MKRDVSKKNTIFEIEPKIELLQRIMLYEAKKKCSIKRIQAICENSQKSREFEKVQKNILIDDVQLKLIVEII